MAPKPEIQKCVNRIKNLKGQITKLKNKVTVDDVLEIDRLELMREKCQIYSVELTDIYKQMCDISDETDIETYIDEQDIIQMSIDDIYLLINREISKQKLSLGKSTSFVSKPELNSTNAVVDVKLPKLFLPVFNGSLHEWLTFYDLFKASVHSNSNLSNAQKLQYLKSSLKGDAYRIIQSVPICDDNYVIAWNLLKDRYSNKREQIFAHVKRLISLPQIQTESPSAILGLVDNVNEITRSLEILEQKIDGFSDTLVLYIILQKLDNSTKMWFERDLSKEVIIPKLSELIDFLKSHARILQNSKPMVQKKLVYQKSTVLLSNSSNSACLFCNGSHDSFKCKNSSAVENFNKLKGQSRCYKCFKKFHLSKNCRVNKNNCRKCNSKFHSEVICVWKPRDETEQNKEKLPFQSENENFQIADSSETLVSSVCESQVPSLVLLQSGTANVVSNSKEGQIKFIMDSASMKSFVLRSVVTELRLPIIRKEKISVFIFEGRESSERIYDVVKLTLITRNNKRIHLEAFVTEMISGARISSPTVEVERLLKKRAIPRHLCCFSSGDREVELLIGADNYFKVNTGNICKLDRHLTAIETVFGYTVLGRVFHSKGNRNMKKENSNSVLGCHIGVDENSMDNQLKLFWEMEGMGISQSIKEENTAFELETLDKFSKEIKLVNERYEVKLPFKDEVRVSDNYHVARKRLNGLMKRFCHDTKLYDEYKGIIESQLNEGIIEMASNDCSLNEVYYMPHRPVIRNDKDTTRVRIVFDASSKDTNCLSLNDNLFPGPNLVPNLLEILLRFRIHKIGLISDVEKAFLQIGITEKHRDFLRFLWIDKYPPENIEVFRMKRVTFGVASSPFLLAATIKHHIANFKDSHPDTVTVLNEDLYVDDLITGCSNVNNALKLSQDAKYIMQKASMNLRKWRTNSRELSAKWEDLNFEEVTKGNHLVSLKVLGIIWNTEEDVLKLELSSMLDSLDEGPNTKRGLLKMSCRLYDPLGLISPIIIRIKILFQQLWERGIGWDEHLPEDLQCMWDKWCNEVPNLQELSVPRFLGNDSSEYLLNMQVHIFCDSSQVAYGAVAYCRFQISETCWKTSFITSKSRVAPIKKLTLPKLELMAALVGAKLACLIKETFGLKRNQFHMWTDSEIALCWIKGSAKRWKPFIANRVIDIQQRTEPKDWKHCSGRENPADTLSRGCSVKNLLEDKRWWSGPEFLCKNEDDWPRQKSDRLTTNLLIEDPVMNIAIYAVTEDQNADEKVCGIIENLVLKFSSWIKLKRVTAWCLRFIRNIRCPDDRTSGFLSIEELRNATHTIIRLIQKTEFSREFNSLRVEKSLCSSSTLLTLNPFVDDEEIIRVGGRLKNSNIPISQKNPIILPKKHYVTDLIIKYYHEKYLHAGTQLLLSVMRQQFWIINAREAVRKIILKCLICCRHRAKLATQQMADLPKARVIPSRVFSRVGIDFSGPFLIKSRKGRGIKPTKCYVCLFICFATKAIHLEVVSDLSAEAFIASLRRFTARRGKPHEIFSDCGTNFAGANKELNKMLKAFNSDEILQNHLSSEGIQWRFNPPSAPHFGGLWEAGIKAMKHHLKRVIGTQVLTHEEFLTLISQIESCLNSRPLCPLSNDPAEFSALTPGHFLVGTSLTALPEGDLSNEKLTTSERWKLTQKLFQSFWKRWSAEYLSELQQRAKWASPKPDLKINSVVLIKDDIQPPLRWRMGRIVELFPGADGKVRVVHLRTATGLLKRPIAKLCVLPID